MESTLAMESDNEPSMTTLRNLPVKNVWIHEIS